MNLIYMCVFHQSRYIDLLKLLIASIAVKGNINRETTDILIMTSPDFQPLIQKELETFDLPIRYHTMNLTTMMEASCCKLRVFEYPDVNRYDKLLYLDTDVLVNSDVNKLFDTDISSEKLHALGEGFIGHVYWGGQFFDFTKVDSSREAFCAGVFYCMNSPSMKALLESTTAHIDAYMKLGAGIPECLDQPFLVYRAVLDEKCDGQFMKKYLENNPKTVSPEKVIYHFAGGPGESLNKFQKMTTFWEKMKITNFDTRNDMLKSYCARITNPRILEIGVFKGEFLDYLVGTCNGSVDAVDLFEHVTCSGDVDGNNVVQYDVRKSYFELLNKYRGNPNVRIIKSDSSTFLENQPDGSYDIIYIDGDHSYAGVKRDLTRAFEKVKDGGYIMGHDYEMNMQKARNSYDFGVKQAVDEFCDTYKQSIAAKALDGCVSYCIHVKKV